MDDRRRYVRLALVAAGLWLLVSVPAALELREYGVLRSAPSFPRLLALSLLRYLPLALLVPVVYLRPGGGGPRARALAWHALVLGVYVIVANAAFTVFELGFRGDAAGGFGAAYLRFLPQRALYGLVTYGIVLAGSQVAALYRERQEQRLLTEQLSRQLSEARLDVLRHQLRPHFLFNTLHAISTLMERDVEESRRMVSLLADLLRASLRGDRAPLVPLSQELEVSDLYLEIERIRFQDRLRVERRIDPGVRDALVPPFVLQPLAENAVVHGIGKSQSARTLTLEAEARGDRLMLRVRDDGPGDPRHEGSHGVGLGNLSERLAALYGGEAQLRTESPADGGFVATVDLPLRRARAGATE